MNEEAGNIVVKGSEQANRALSPYLSPIGAWAFALGTSIGWGSLVVTSNSYLLQAGPWGSIFGLLVGAAVMFIVARNYHYLINCFPDAGGAYTYSKEVFGLDYGFLTAWFLALTYLAMFWANVTSLPLFARYFMGAAFSVGFHYTVFGYDVYFGEAMLSVCAILLTAFACMRFRKALLGAMVACAVLIIVGITVCFVGAASGFAGQGASFEPGFLPDSNALSQVFLIACISPWAFIGFENISHSSEEFTFARTKVFRIFVAAIVSATALYVFLLLLSVMAYPPQYNSWFAYLSDLGNLSGLAGLPPFYVAYHYLGDVGVWLLMATLLALVITSLIGNTVALSRLFYALAKDSIIPASIAQVNEHHIPANAVMLVAGLSIVLPFLGRTAIGWIVDVTTIGATFIYCIVSAAALKVARARDNKTVRITGIFGVGLTIIIAAYLLLPSLFMSHTLEQESYFLFAAWGILGFAFFRILLARDVNHRFGRSTIVWIGLLSLVMFISFVWMNQAITNSVDETMNDIVTHYQDETGEPLQEEGDEFVEEQLAALDQADSRSSLVAALLLGVATVMLLANFSYMSRWARESEKELGLTREIVYTDPLTGLPSMSRFYGFAQAGAEAIRSSGGHPAAIALDLVGMKDFNSKHGRDGGDQLLRAFADVLRRHFTEESCSRFAEDHFYAFAEEAGLAEVIQAVFDDFANANDKNTLPVRVGVYVCLADDDIVKVGFDRARAACDLDRKTWQSHVSWFTDSMDDEAKLRLHVLDSVDQAIEQRWIRPYYQAIVNAETRNVCDEEALARWIDPEFGFLAPIQFIPTLEEAGLLHKVDMHIIDCVLEDIATKRARGIPIVPISINLSLRDLAQLDIANEIASKVDAAGVSHDLLHIEFTESAASDDPAVFKTTVDALRANGFEVWIDDFGSGYSSLNSLKDFEFDAVKLDMDFLRGDDSKKTWDIIAGVIGIIQKLGKRSLAEGVETEAQAQQLTDIGCSMLQGYFFTKPLPLEKVIELYDEGQGTNYEL